MNTYHIHYYGLLADRRGVSEETIHHRATTPAALYQELFGNGTAPESIRAAVNDEFVAWEHSLANNDRIAFLPPMSGG
ncbi:MAG TPA: MoaD/ThiS family protein [Luteolibacter sp.]|nr:MoaD/ThiS family protein [Luteolibacter sp.]